MYTTLLFIFNMVVAYLVGSVCSAVIVCRIFNLPDPRTEGSKNPGATNVMRLAGKKYALIVLVADMLKGLLPVLLAKMLGAGSGTVAFTCFAAVIGHMFPVFFDFKGGKGVATTIGALLGFHFMLGVMLIATWLLVANFTRYSSLASIIAVVLTPFYSLFALGSVDAFLPLSFIAIFVLFKHRNNITRLLDGNEPKLHFKRNMSKKGFIDEDLLSFEEEKEAVSVAPPKAKPKPAPRKTKPAANKTKKPSRK